MATLWTDEQLLAINSKDKATIVSAAAGSGKTAVLVERTIRMLADESLGIEADKLLAVTFTNDAANNMKSKLSSAMAKILEESPENHWVSKQQERLSLASICTIDSFCMELVKNNINDLDVSGSFTMIDAQEHDILTQKAFMETAEEYYKNKPELMKILLDNFAEEDDSEIIKYASQLLKFKGSLPFPEQWKKKADESLEKGYDNVLKTADKSLRKNAERISACRKALSSIAKKLGKDELYKPVLDLMSAFEKTISDEKISYDDLLKSDDYKTFCKPPYPRKPNAKTLSEEQKDQYLAVDSVKKNYQAIIKDIEDNRPLSDKEISRQAADTIAVFDALWEFTKDAEKLLWEYKLEKNKLHFSDVTKLTIKLLAVETDNGFEKTELAKSFTRDGKYRIILIDEFQDINLI